MSHAQQAQISREVCFVQAYAKINLTLDVLRRRTDGYHELATVMQTIDLHDTICLTTTNDQRVQVFCTTPALSNTDNLAARAVDMVRQHFALRQGVRIELYKRIPTVAGLGGGSSDAAAVLRALRQWWQLPLSPSDLLSMAASLGSDVPFFLTGGTALCEGRGEQITPLAHHWPASMRWLLLLKPSISLSTAAVFRDLPASDYTDGTFSKTVCSALRANGALQLEHLHNCLERGVLERYPSVNQAREDLLSAGARVVRLSGSGPTLYAPFAELASALRAQHRAQALGYEVYLSRAMNPNPGDVCLY
ncbi:MAG TPA: 4-(cytidine 5'-diphospho)-2-C-methyl-D-erythritol kinase [Ktedonobacteraceae bacterium]|nr:4-(cytidine 5'-diphospho)-2-C-methyl-D-erythritol kinase [Ktedonobacteraceae bacterium]